MCWLVHCRSTGTHAVHPDPGLEHDHRHGPAEAGRHPACRRHHQRQGRWLVTDCLSSSATSLVAPVGSRAAPTDRYCLCCRRPSHGTRCTLSVLASLGSTRALGGSPNASPPLGHAPVASSISRARVSVCLCAWLAVAAAVATCGRRPPCSSETSCTGCACPGLAAALLLKEEVDLITLIGAAAVGLRIRLAGPVTSQVTSLLSASYDPVPQALLKKAAARPVRVSGHACCLGPAAADNGR